MAVRSPPALCQCCTIRESRRTHAAREFSRPQLACWKGAHPWLSLFRVAAVAAKRLGMTCKAWISYLARGRAGRQYWEPERE